MFVVAGVTGKTGSVVAETLLSAGKKVRVLVRDASKGAGWSARGAEVRVLATLDDEAGLTAALEGAQGVYLLSPPDVRTETFLADRRKTHEALAAAVDRSRVPHVVFLSSIGAHRPDGTGPIRSVHDAEARLAKTAARLTFVRAGFFLENWGASAAAVKGGTLPTFLPADLSIPMVATRDIGLVSARALLEGPPSSRVDILELAGSRDLTPRDVAGIFAKLLGKPVQVAEAPLDAVVPTFTSLGFSKDVSALYREMNEGFASGTIAWEGGSARFVRGAADPESVLAALL